MAGASLLTLIDDIASLLDDVALLTKVAAKKTAGVLGDDLALNAQQVSGFHADRELPVVWAVAKGSFRNKLILVPAALAISAVVPWLVAPLLMVGGAWLCFEGVEKIVHGIRHRKAEPDDPAEAVAEAVQQLQAPPPEVDSAALEKERIGGAIRTDFILSAEIVTITLGTVAEAPFLTRVTVLSGIALLMTVGVYGLVAGIVKLDDAGLHLSLRSGDGVGARIQRGLGFGILAAAPWLMKALSVGGMLAMFLVGGGILTHGIPPVHHAVEAWSEAAGAVPGAGGVLAALVPVGVNLGVGLLAGAGVLALLWFGKRAWGAIRRR